MAIIEKRTNADYILFKKWISETVCGAAMDHNWFLSMQVYS